MYLISFNYNFVVLQDAQLHPVPHLHLEPQPHEDFSEEEEEAVAVVVVVVVVAVLFDPHILIYCISVVINYGVVVESIV